MINKLLLSILIANFLCTAVWAAPRLARPLSPARARAIVEQHSTVQEVVRERQAGRDITLDPTLMERVNRMVDGTLEGAVSLTPTDRAGLNRLIAINAIEVLSEVTRLSSISKAESSTAAQRRQAALALNLIAKAARGVSIEASGAAARQAQRTEVALIVDVAVKISTLNLGEASQRFIERFEAELSRGKNINEAVELASNGRFTAREIRECT